jgi:hypothetical protein
MQRFKQEVTAHEREVLDEAETEAERVKKSCAHTQCQGKGGLRAYQGAAYCRVPRLLIGHEIVHAGRRRLMSGRGWRLPTASRWAKRKRSIWAPSADATSYTLTSSPKDEILETGTEGFWPQKEWCGTDCKFIQVCCDAQLILC